VVRRLPAWGGGVDLGGWQFLLGLLQGGEKAWQREVYLEGRQLLRWSLGGEQDHWVRRVRVGGWAEIQGGVAEQPDARKGIVQLAGRSQV
jgi:hypothetical protein